MMMSNGKMERRHTIFIRVVDVGTTVQQAMQAVSLAVYSGIEECFIVPGVLGWRMYMA
jgi:hypothetical protein